MLSTILLASQLLAAPVPTPDTVSNAVEITRLMLNGVDAPVPFDIEATATTAFEWSTLGFNVQDTSGNTHLVAEHTNFPHVLAGDRIHASGSIHRHTDGVCYPFFSRLTVLGHTARPEPIEIDVDDFYHGRFAYALVRLSGTVVDAFRDEANPRYIFLAVVCGRGTIYLASTRLLYTDVELAALVGASVTAVGHCTCYRGLGPRAKLGYEIFIEDPADLTVVRPAPDDPFDVPTLEGNVYEVLNPPAHGPRRRKLTGLVLAVWQRQHLLVRTPDGEFSTIALAEPTPPDCGETIDVAGQPETDFYHLNLSRAIWRKSDLRLPRADTTPESVSVATLLTDSNGARRFNVDYHGRSIRLTGAVRTIRQDDEGVTFQLECDDIPVLVDASCLPNVASELSIDTKVEIEGICLMVTENWQPHAPFPHIREMSVILRSPQDLHILSRPPWWTVGRLSIVVVSLLAILLAIAVWNRVLNHLVNRRGHELLRAQLDNAKVALKAEERTRLAVELHDTIAQNLTGAALEIEASRELKGDAPNEMLVHLELADRTLKSCRDDLRNCLWDLRSRALEFKTMDQAILRTLQPHVADSRLAVRFNVPRSRLSESVAHTILKIVRELVLNAIRHGAATDIRIAGSLDGDQLCCSVADNGCGFDPDTAPGVLQGHFGLQGVSERLTELGGEFSIASSPNKGTKVTFTLRLPPQTRENHE